MNKMNLLESVTKEIKRCEELKKVYLNLGISGQFGLIAIIQDIEKAETARDGGDIIEIISALEKLQEDK